MVCDIPDAPNETNAEVSVNIKHGLFRGPGILKWNSFPSLNFKQLKKLITCLTCGDTKGSREVNFHIIHSPAPVWAGQDLLGPPWSLNCEVCGV